jgi:hypothetical protein
MPQLPDYLTAEASELIEDQYADRPQLRPILDAVLALLPALGPATVQARKTIVSLVCPRRTFAVVRATTKGRVDLGLGRSGGKPKGTGPDQPVPDLLVSAASDRAAVPAASVRPALAAASVPLRWAVSLAALAKTAPASEPSRTVSAASVVAELVAC